MELKLTLGLFFLLLTEEKRVGASWLWIYYSVLYNFYSEDSYFSNTTCNVLSAASCYFITLPNFWTRQPPCSLRALSGDSASGRGSAGWNRRRRRLHSSILGPGGTLQTAVHFLGGQPGQLGRRATAYAEAGGGGITCGGRRLHRAGEGGGCLQKPGHPARPEGWRRPESPREMLGGSQGSRRAPGRLEERSQRLQLPPRPPRPPGLRARVTAERLLKGAAAARAPAPAPAPEDAACPGCCRAW